jgi:hypothetical protein
VFQLGRERTGYNSNRDNDNLESQSLQVTTVQVSHSQSDASSEQDIGITKIGLQIWRLKEKRARVQVDRGTILCGVNLV